MANPSVVFLTSRAKSLGESYTALRIAHDLEEHGWSATFLAFEFAAAFLRDQGAEVVDLRADRAHNEASFRSAQVRQAALMITVDYYLLCSADASPYWDPRWLDEFGRPVATLDHLGFHPGASTLEIGYARVATTHPKTPSNVPIEELPAAVCAVLRPCPLHSPAAGADSRVQFFRLSAESREREAGVDVRSQLGIDPSEKLVALSVGSWALEATNALRIPYRETVTQLIVKALAELDVPVRLAFVCAEERERVESVGRLKVQYLGRLPFAFADSLLSAADLVLSDNVTSSTVSRAVMRQVPTAVLVNSVEASARDDALSITAPFAVSDAARLAIRRMDAAAPGSVFPFWVYPMGWRRALAPLFHDNPYRSTTEWVELFDEDELRETLGRFLCDSAYRADVRERQRSYADSIAKVPLPRDVVRRLLGN